MGVPPSGQPSNKIGDLRQPQGRRLVGQDDFQPHVAPAKKLTPVRFPPGCPKLSTRPSFTGSSPATNTIGIVVVAALTADAEVPVVAMTATPRRTNSAASAGSRSI